MNWQLDYETHHLFGVISHVLAHEDNFNLQMTKLGSGLMNGDYSKDQSEAAENSNEVSFFNMALLCV